MKSLMLLCFLPFLLLSCDARERKTVDDYLNICMEGLHHKYKAGPEGSLYKQCSPWKKHSCCRGNISKEVHVGKLYNFNVDHCGPLSPKCRSHFIQDLCFYECTPNGGPWLVKDSGMKIRKERYFNMPLCANECTNWWDSCKDDYTCTENWTRGFHWTTGTNTCPEGSKCRKFKEVFKSSKDFCEKVWDHTWKVASEEEPCFRIWFNGEDVNPNNVLALEKAKQIVSGSPNISYGSVLLIVLLQAVYVSFN